MISLVFLSSVTAHGRRRASQFHNKQGNYLQSAPSFWGIKLRRDDKIPPGAGFFFCFFSAQEPRGSKVLCRTG